MYSRSGGYDRRGPGETRRSWRSTFESFRYPQYRWLYASNVAFFFGMSAQSMIVRPWIAFQLTDSPLALGIIGAMVAVPMILVAPFGGVVADRLERRNLIVIGQSAVVASEFVVLGLLWLGILQFWQLVLASLVMGCVFPFTMPARAAIIVNIVGKRGLANAMGRSMGSMNATRMIAPAIAGVLIWLIDVERTYLFGVVLYVIALLCMFGVNRTYPPERAEETSVMTDIAEGFRYMRDHRVVLVLLLFGLVPMFLAMPFQTLLVVFTDRIWDVGPQGLGLLQAVAGFGGFAGSIYVAWQGEAGGRLRQMMTSVLAFGGFVLLFALSPWFLLALPLVFASNIFASVFQTLNNTMIQQLIPDHVRGRISSFLMMSFGLPLLGTLPMSAVAEVYGAPVAVACAALFAIVVAIAFYIFSPALRGIAASMAAAMAEVEASEASAESEPVLAGRTRQESSG